MVLNNPQSLTKPEQPTANHKSYRSFRNPGLDRRPGFLNSMRDFPKPCVRSRHLQVNQPFESLHPHAIDGIRIGFKTPPNGDNHPFHFTASPGMTDNTTLVLLSIPERA